MAVFDCHRTEPGFEASTRGARYWVGSKVGWPAIKGRVAVRGVRAMTPLLLALAVMAVTGCASGGEGADLPTEQADRSSEHRPAPAPAETTPVAPPARPATEQETPEASLVRLSEMWDEAFARRDEALLRRVFHPSFTGLDGEIANMNSPENKGTATPVTEITIESEAPERVVLTATFGYDEGPVRQRILLLGDASDRRIAGVQDLER